MLLVTVDWFLIHANLINRGETICLVNREMGIVHVCHVHRTHTYMTILLHEWGGITPQASSNNKSSEKTTSNK